MHLEFALLRNHAANCASANYVHPGQMLAVNIIRVKCSIFSGFQK